MARILSLCIVGVITLAFLRLPAAGQAVFQEVPRTHPVQPSNAQLASPAIERRVDALLKQMTLEEKIGQLVQYNDAGYSGPALPADQARRSWQESAS
jgi:beta-glucosidase